MGISLDYTLPRGPDSLSACEGVWCTLPLREWRCLCITQGKNSERLLFVYKQTKMFFVFAQTKHFFQDLVIMTLHFYKQGISIVRGPALIIWHCRKRAGSRKCIHCIMLSTSADVGRKVHKEVAPWHEQPSQKMKIQQHFQAVTELQSPAVTNQLSESMWSVVLAFWRQKTTSRSSPICLRPLSGAQVVPELTEDHMYGGKVKS